MYQRVMYAFNNVCLHEILTIAKPYLVPTAMPPLNNGFDVIVGNTYPQRCTMLIDGFVMDGSLGRGVGCIGGIVEPDTGVAADVFSLSSCLKAFSLRSSFTFLLRSKLSSSCLNASMNPNHKLIMHICMYLCMYV